jgi:opacity protein-like surface antigen
MRGFITFVLSLAVCCASATAGNWYTSIYGGGNWTEGVPVPGVDEQRGTVVGGTFGKALDGVPGLRVEADLSYRTHNVDVFGFLEAKHETTGLLFNVAYDFGSGPVKPYVLVGGGYAHTQATFESISLLRIEQGDMAYQLGAGVQIEFAKGVRAGVGYRFFQGPELEVLGTDLHDGVNHSAVASLGFDL